MSFFYQDYKSIPRLSKKYDFTHPLIYNDNIAYTDNKKLFKYQDSTVLIVGGGESSQNISDIIFNQYDFVWSMNSFFKHPILNRNPVSLVGVSSQTSLSDLSKYTSKYSVITAFDATASNLNRSKDINNYKNELGCKIFFHTNVFTFLGYGVRMMILAAELKVNQIDFIGFDGYPSIKNKTHAFQKGKSQLPAIAKQSKAPDQLFKNEYNKYWQYIKKTYPKLSIQHIGPYNRYHDVVTNKVK